MVTNLQFAGSWNKLRLPAAGYRFFEFTEKGEGELNRPSADTDSASGNGRALEKHELHRNLLTGRAYCTRYGLHEWPARQCRRRDGFRSGVGFG